MIRFSPVKDYFLAVLASVVSDSPPPLPSSGFNETSFLALCKRQKLAGMVCDGIERFALPLSDTIRADFRREKKRELARDLIQMNETAKIFKIFEKNEIPFLPLKGYRVRDFYPSPEMRTMLDVDILVPSESMERVNQILMTELGYHATQRVRNVQPYYKQPAMLLEIHEELFPPERVPRFRTDFPNLRSDKLWSRLLTRDGWRYQREMTEDDFLLFYFVHLSRHFTTVGIGVRFILDYHLLKRGEISMEKSADALEEGGLTPLAQKIDAVANVWFGLKKPDDSLRELENFILSGGLLGKEENLFVNQLNERTMTEVSGGGRFRCLIRSLFPPLSLMTEFYPFLHKIPVLYPLFWIRLSARRLFRFSYYWRMLTAIFRLSAREADAAEKLYQSCGLEIKTKGDSPNLF